MGTCTWAPDESRLIEMVLMRSHNVCFIEGRETCLCVVFGIPYFLELCHPTHSSVGEFCPRRSRYDPCCSGVRTVFRMFHISPIFGLAWSLREIATGAGWYGSCRAAGHSRVSGLGSLYFGCLLSSRFCMSFYFVSLRTEWRRMQS